MNYYGKSLFFNRLAEPPRVFKISGNVVLSGSGRSNALITLLESIDAGINKISSLLSAALGADDSAIGTLAWTNPTNIYTSNNVYATAVSASGDTTHYLKASTFGFQIPADAVITGIKVEIERKADRDDGNGYAADNRIRIIKGGSIGAKELAVATHWPTSDAYALYGGDGENWGEIWTPADINASNFGVAISAGLVSSLSTTTASIDHVRITVYYSLDKRVIGNKLTDGSGNYSFDAGFEVNQNRIYEVTAEYDDGTNKYNSKSQPYVVPVEN